MQHFYVKMDTSGSLTNSFFFFKKGHLLVFDLIAILKLGRCGLGVYSERERICSLGANLFHIV